MPNINKHKIANNYQNFSLTEMDTKKIPETRLSSGQKMPVIGLGTGAYPRLPAEQMVPLLVDAIAAGYRHLDSASMYGTEESIGRAAVEAVQRGLIKSRDELFITTKLHMTDSHHHQVLPAIQQSLRNLGLEYVDLYLVHWPVSMKKDENGGVKLVNFEIKEIWEGMEECSRMGLAKSIGVCNFSTTKLSTLLQIATIKPAVNQVEMNVGWQQLKMVQYCKEKGIHVTAWSPLGAPARSAWSTNAVMESPILTDIAAALNKTVAQVALRWIYEQGASMIVRSFNRDRMRQNLHILDWELREEDGEKIKQIPQSRVGKGVDFVSPDGQYKTLEELWDGEI